MSEDSVDEIWVSNKYTSIFFSKQEVRNCADSLMPKDGILPSGTNFVCWQKKLRRKYTKNEILHATFDELKEMIL
jgi:hypothetical protein